MRFYFDSNIYRFITEAGEIETVARLLSGSGHSVLASSTNLFEVYAISEDLRRSKELHTLVSIASSYEREPKSWHCAQELVSEIKRLRPDWLQSAPRLKKARDLLRKHRKRWVDAQNLDLPPKDAYSAHHILSEGGIRTLSAHQKEMRQLIGNDTSRLEVGTGKDPSEIIRGVELDDSEAAWRLARALIWNEAIRGKDPVMGDYLDWLGPYLKPEAFPYGSSYLKFWLDEVDGERLPNNRIDGLAGHFQLQRKITHGNNSDISHAQHLLDVDLFFTADQSFHWVLKQISEQITGLAEPVFLDRSLPSVTAQLAGIVQT